MQVDVGVAQVERLPDHHHDLGLVQELGGRDRGGAAPDDEEGAVDTGLVLPRRVGKAPRDRQLAFLDEVATVYVGPAEKRNEFVKKNYNRNQIQWGTPNGRIYVYGQLMEQLCQRSELMFTALEHLEQYDEPKPVNNYEYRVQEAIRQLQSRLPVEARKRIRQ